MKVKDVMTENPVCCVSSHSAKTVAGVLRDEDIGSVPVVTDKSSMKLEGIITDRDLCCKVLAEGLDPNTSISGFISRNPVTCRQEDDIEDCERAMQEHQVRRIPVVNDTGACIGVVAQADLALMEQPERVHETVAEISSPSAGPLRRTA